MNNNNANYHVKQNKERFRKSADHLREDIEKIDDPKCKAMFETAAEVLLGLVKAFDDYENKSEKVWQ